MLVESEIKAFKPTKRKATDVWSLVGLPSRGQALYHVVNVGLETIVYERLAGIMDADMKQLAKRLSIPETTIHRRKQAGRFNRAESDKIVRATEVFDAAVELFEGDRKAANDWMRSKVKGLGDKTPMEMLGTSVESEAVLDLIGRLEHGVFA